MGDQVRFTIRAAKIGVTFDAQGPKQWQGDDTLLVPINIKKMGVRAKGDRDAGARRR